MHLCKYIRVIIPLYLTNDKMCSKLLPDCNIFLKFVYKAHTFNFVNFYISVSLIKST